MELKTAISNKMETQFLSPFTVSLLAGSGAGTAVDCTLFPLDSIKTRLQSAAGFWASGGFSGIYRGIGPAFIGSAPTAIFFATYDTTKLALERVHGRTNDPFTHMAAAMFGETIACLVRVPIEIVKQRRQVSAAQKVSGLIQGILHGEGPLGFYRGYFGTIMREIPFAIIQFPLWEFLKHQVAERHGSVTAYQSSVCGAVAGGFAAAITTPLDVVKTRIMLAESSSIESSGKILIVMKRVYGQQGIKGLFAGMMPRTLWISIGGFIFFGTYEVIKRSIVSL